MSSAMWKRAIDMKIAESLSVLRLDRLRAWSRLGRGTRVCIQMFKTRGLADMALASVWTQKLKKGYR